MPRIRFSRTPALSTVITTIDKTIRIRCGPARWMKTVLPLLLLSILANTQTNTSAPDIKAADLGNGITLHYSEAGAGTPVIFVHGSLSDGGYWADQLGPFAHHYHAIAYSRRYNFPNTNPARPGYSAVTDGEDLAGLIKALHLEKAVVVGHSYGALAALFLAAQYPELVRAVVLAEPPAVSLLNDLPGNEHARGRAMFDDIQRRMVKPMQQAYREGNGEEGIRIFIDYVFNDPHAWDRMSRSSREQALRDGHEWDVMMTTGTLFPTITPSEVKKISAPILMMQGAKSYPFLILIEQELGRLLPKSRTVVYPDAGHQMWMQDPKACRHDVEKFLADYGID